MRKTTRFRQLLAQEGAIVVPLVYDGLSARLVEQAGFDMLGVTGAGLSASLLGLPDVGLLSMAEVLQQVRNIVQATRLPVLADCDTGYGNAINMLRTLREFEAAGVGGIFFEDQVAPKRCGHFQGKEVIPIHEMVGKIRAAVDTRQDPDLVLVARTDARAVLGLDEAIARGNAYAEAGADVIYVEAPASLDELRQIAQAIGAPLMCNLVEGGVTPLVPVPQLAELGYKIVSFSNSLSRAGAKAMQRVLVELQRTGTTAGVMDDMISFAERNQILGLEEFYHAEERYLHQTAD